MDKCYGVRRQYGTNAEHRSHDESNAQVDPSLKGVWYRGPFEHNGSVARLEDWFDSARIREDYIPTGFVGYGVKSRAVKGHEFGLRLSANDKQALIAFLRTL